MQRVRWTDNICTVGSTCIHGYFDGDDLTFLLSLCPNGSFTPTYYHERFPASGKSDPSCLKQLKFSNFSERSLYDTELGYYFDFTESEGHKLLNWLKERYPMVRGEGCH